MSAGYTPGPWVYSFESEDPDWAIVTTVGGSVIANVNADHRLAANVALIASAPDLLQELRNIANADTAEWDDKSEFEVWAKSRASAAIAKATVSAA